MIEPCEVQRVFDDGALELVWLDSGAMTRAVLSGIEPVKPLPPLYREILTVRLAATGRAPRAETRRRADDGVAIRLLAFSWHDKSGEVWEDVAELLLRNRLATVAPGDFPERASYERAAANV